jgi:multiple sugar transport system substrate-binding protein
MFDEVGQAYPPQVYGERYVLDGREVDWSWDTLTQVARRLTLDANNYNATQPESEEDLDFDTEFQKLQADLTFIYNK